jgi:FtsP/CotA-like multicopper oxidase with cupredoxin domain
VQEGRRFGRRAFLAGVGAAGATLALPVRPRLPGIGLSHAAALRPFARRLPIPEVLGDPQIPIEIRAAEVEILPGRPTKMWTYGGSFPGPTIRRPSGEDTEVTFTNELPSAAGELSVHLHGGHNPAAHDGQPGAPPASPTAPQAFCDIDGDGTGDGSQLLIAPGESRTYTYPMVESAEGPGSPERAALHWYHDHRCHQTARNVWRGLAGMWITDDDVDASLPLPSGDRDIPLMITDRSFTRRNQLTNPYEGGEGGGAPPSDGVTGKLVLVNGAYLPHLDVSGRRYRLRVLNASNLRSYNLRLSNGAPMRQVATESGLMPAPLDRRTILLGPGERVEVVIDFAEFPNRDVRLESVARKPQPDHRSAKSYVGPLMEFRVGRRRQDQTSVPSELRPLPAWTEDIPAKDSAQSHTWAISIESSGFSRRWAINGQQYDPDFVERSAHLDTTETWTLRNDTIAAHLVHLHHTDWYMVERNGVAPKAWERCLKETFLLDPEDEVVIAGRFSDHLGKYVVHCHMLDHEDHGLMSQFEVVA